MYKKFLTLISIFVVCLLVAACGMPEEKIAQAQERYAQLVEVHNQVVEAHKNVEDNSLDGALTELRDRVSGMEAYNLAEMEEEEIDRLIQEIDSIISEYKDYLVQLSNIKGREDDAILTPFVITLLNRTGVSFSDLQLYEQGSSGVRVNILEDLELFVPGQYLTGLLVMRDVDNTPWFIVLTDENGMEYEVPLAVEEYKEENISLALDFGGAQGELAAVMIESNSQEEQAE